MQFVILEHLIQYELFILCIIFAQDVFEVILYPHYIVFLFIFEYKGSVQISGVTAQDAQIAFVIFNEIYIGVLWPQFLFYFIILYQSFILKIFNDPLYNFNHILFVQVCYNLHNFSLLSHYYYNISWGYLSRLCRVFLKKSLDFWVIFWYTYVKEY